MNLGVPYPPIAARTADLPPAHRRPGAGKRVPFHCVDLYRLVRPDPSSVPSSVGAPSFADTDLPWSVWRLSRIELINLGLRERPVMMSANERRERE